MKTKATNSGYIIHARRTADAEKFISVICHERQMYLDHSVTNLSQA